MMRQVQTYDEFWSVHLKEKNKEYTTSRLFGVDNHWTSMVTNGQGDENQPYNPNVMVS